MQYQTVQSFEEKRVFVLLKDGTEHFGKICEVNNTTFQMEIATNMSDSTIIRIPLNDTEKVVSKDNIYFVRPKFVLSKESNAAITHQIEAIKKWEEFSLKTRRYKEQVNGSRKRTKWSVQEFEKEVAKWLDPAQRIEICPFALVMTKKEEFLLGVNRSKKLQRISKNGTTVLV